MREHRQQTTADYDYRVKHTVICVPIIYESFRHVININISYYFSALYVIKKKQSLLRILESLGNFEVVKIW